MGLFASLENAHCEMWFSLRPHDLAPLGVDAIAHSPWPQTLLYAFPLEQLIYPLLERIQQESLSLILVAPDKRSALWFPEQAALCVWHRGRSDARSEAHGSVHYLPYLWGRLLVWLLKAKLFPPRLSILFTSSLYAEKWGVDALSFKVALLLALVSAKCAGELTNLSARVACCVMVTTPLRC